MKKLALVLVSILIATTLGCVFPDIAFAASETIYTGVLEDLQRDETFDVAAFPAKSTLSADDKVMDVIQIAESNDGELFLYVYQPIENKYTAIETRISTTIGENLAPQDYKLTLLDRDGTLEKYKVEGLHVKSDAVRYYLIVQIARAWEINDGTNISNAFITGATQSANKIDTVCYAVEKLFTACTLNNTITYSEEHAETIVITDKYVSKLRYLNGYSLMVSSCDSHYIAFSTDIPMEYLYEVDVSFIRQHYYKQTPANIEKYGEKITENVTLTSEDYSSNKPSFLNKKYEWKRIEKVEDFITNEDLTDSELLQLKNKQWILRFYDSLYTVSYGKLYKNEDMTLCSEVTILRLKFFAEGQVYNLGVVDNKQSQSPDQQPGNNPENPLEGFKALLKQMEELWNKIVYGFNWLLEHWWYIIIGIVAIALVIALIVAFIKFGFKLVMKAIGKVLLFVLKLIGKVLWFILKWLPPGLIITLLYYGIRAVKKNKQ